jgi:hypothetical protein
MRRLRGGVATGRLRAGNGRCYRPVTVGSGILGGSELARVTGTASPNHASQRVYLQRLVDGAWKTAAATLSSGSGHAPGAKKTVTVPVRPAADRRVSSGLRGPVTSEVGREMATRGHVDVRVAPLRGLRRGGVAGQHGGSVPGP